MGARVVTFGEVMGRINPPGFRRFAQSLPGNVEFTFGGGEINVAVAVAALGGESAFVTVLPRNPLADACIAHLRGMGVDTSGVVRSAEGRLGLYFLETGASQRGGAVIYDRDRSAIALAPPAAYDWPAALEGARWFHVTGITPAISAPAAQATLDAVRAAGTAGVSVSCDLNFRKKLWNWEPGVKPRDLAERTMRGILPFVDLVIANEEDAAMVLSIHAEGADVEAGKLEVAAYRAVARTIVEQFPNVSRVAITLRESVSASHNNWGGMLYDAASEQACLAPLGPDGGYRPYEIRDIVDRVGAGDSFSGALLFALSTPELAAPELAVRFAAAASCLKHTHPGDFLCVTRAEAEALMGGSGSGRVNR